MILHPQTGHGGVRRQPCRSRLPAGRSLNSAALSWSEDDVYRLAASPGQLARGKPSTPLRGTAPRANHRQKPGLFWTPVARCPSVARRPIPPTTGYATATNVDVNLRVVCGPCRGERWTSKCRSTCRFKRSSDEHGKDHHEELRRSPAARSRPRGWY